MDVVKRNHKGGAMDAEFLVSVLVFYLSCFFFFFGRRANVICASLVAITEQTMKSMIYGRSNKPSKRVSCILLVMDLGFFMSNFFSSFLCINCSLMDFGQAIKVFV